VTAPIVPADDAGIARAVRVLRAGGLVALPTDTVYGLAAALDRPAALRRVFAVKERSETKTLPILLDDSHRLALVAARIDPRLAQFADRFWPGPLTVALPARPGLPAEVLAPDGTIGVRVPAGPVARRVIAGAGGALAVTSANPSGQPPATSAETVRDQLSGAIDLILDGGPSPGGVASTVVRIDPDGPTILRPGAVPADELRAAWQAITSADE
jgi:L-threonylcarbamoyladenylate synthase